MINHDYATFPPPLGTEVEIASVCYTASPGLGVLSETEVAQPGADEHLDELKLLPALVGGRAGSPEKQC